MAKKALETYEETLKFDPNNTVAKKRSRNTCVNASLNRNSFDY
jgi:hypothetical protein